MKLLKMELAIVVLSLFVIVFLGITEKTSWGNGLLTDNDTDDTGPQISEKKYCLAGNGPKRSLGNISL